ncbi:MAG: AAA family ATPase [Fibrobacter sp.]|nr:AAA family ATPase [Fibrobacter sp.]
MKLRSFTIENYRSIKNASKIAISDLTTIIGRNNEGKSNILRALNVAMTIIGNRRILASARLRSNKEDFFYDWKRDFPIDLQDQIESGKTAFELEFSSFSSSEKQGLEKILGKVYSKDSISIRIEIGIQEKPSITCEYGDISEFTGEITDFVSSHITFNYIPAIRTNENAEDVVQSLVSLELKLLEDDKNYKKALETIKKIREPLLKKVSKNVKKNLIEFLPSIKDVRIEFAENSRMKPFLRESINIVIDDGQPTNLEYKGDGIKSLVTMGLLKNRGDAGTPSIIAIEEPESHLHSSAIDRLKKILEDLSRTSQVIVSSHNPILVNRYDQGVNILVENGRAVFRPNIRQIRDSLGIKISDNLTDAENVILVEGETDKVILVSFIKTFFPKIYKEIERNTVIVQSSGGTANMPAILKTYSMLVCKVFVVTDADKPARETLKKLKEDGLVLESDYCSLTCTGKTESEIEDVFNPASYLDFINERYDIHLVSKDLNGNLKWSEKIGKILNGKGKSFEKEDITDLKQSVAEKIAKNMKKAYDKQQCPALYDFIKNIEKKILHSNH